MRGKKEYLAKMRWRYGRAQRRGKSRLIEELVALCGYSRKHAISLLNGRGRPRVLQRRGAKRIYPEEVRVVLSGSGLPATSLRQKAQSGFAPLAAAL
jgi:hypothetical protein